MSPERRAMAAFQAAFLDALARHDTPEAALEALRDDPASRPFSAYLDTLEPRMLAVAQELMRRYAVRR